MAREVALPIPLPEASVICEPLTEPSENIKSLEASRRIPLLKPVPPNVVPVIDVVSGVAILFR